MYCECRKPITWGLDWKEVLMMEKREGMGEWDVGIGLTGKPSMTCLLMLHKNYDNNVMQPGRKEVSQYMWVYSSLGRLTIHWEG